MNFLWSVPMTIKKIILLSVFGLILIFEGCDTQPKPEIHADIDNCAECGMVISQVNQSGGYFHEHEFVTFCSPTCLLQKYQEIDERNRPNRSQIYFADYPSAKFVRADSVHILLTGHISTVMNSEALCFNNKSNAENTKKHEDEILADWDKFQTLRGRPDRTVEVTLFSKGMKPDVVMLKKNEVVEWIFKTEEDLSNGQFRLKGYEELGLIELPSVGTTTKLRMKAYKPGSGFPFVRLDDNATIGMVKVSGAHTSDEEVM